MRVTNHLRFPLVWLLVTGLIAGLATACDGEEEETATATPIAATLTPAAAATPTVVAVPLQPGDFADYPAVIADYLTATGGSPSCLAELFAAWDMPTAVPEWAEEYGATDCAAGDLDGDGEDEYLVRLTDPVETERGQGHESDVLIFDRRAAGYEVACGRAWFETERLWWEQSVIVGVRDFNGDGKVEAAFTTSLATSLTCCSMPVFILAWNESGQEYHNLIPREVAGLDVPPPPEDIYFVDLEGDGIEELYVEGNPNVWGATFTYAWDGISYVKAQTEYEPSAPSVDIRQVDFSEVLGQPWCTNGCMGSGGISDDFIEYADLTGDGHEEAVVPVHSGGTAGLVALWVYGYVDGDLQVLLAMPDMYNGGARVEGSRLIVVQPVYDADDPNCCPSQLTNTYYEWDGSELALVGEETIDNPNLP